LIGDFLIFRAGRIHPRDRSSRAREAFEIRGRTLAMRRNRRAAEQAKSYIAREANVQRSGIVRKVVHVRDVDSLSYSDARANLKAVMDKVVEDRAPITITRARGQENVVMVSAAEWASIEETLYLLRSPANARELLASIAELDAGRGKERSLIEP